jgi:para-nitrobenzyl esterase
MTFTEQFRVLLLGFVVSGCSGWIQPDVNGAPSFLGESDFVEEVDPSDDGGGLFLGDGGADQSVRDVSSADVGPDFVDQTDTSPDVPPAPVHDDAVYSVRETAGVVYGQGLKRTGWRAQEGQAVDLTLDVFEPEGSIERNRPAIVMIHGGGFRTGDSTHPAMVAHARFLAERGWVAFSINYRLERDYGSIPTGWPDLLPDEELIDSDQFNALYPAGRDVKAALRWVHAHAEEYGIHEDHVAVSGGSAGAFLAVMLGASDPRDYRDEIALEDDPTLATTSISARSDVAAVIDFWGSKAMLDVLMTRDSRRRVDSEDAPVLIIHGEDDPTVPFSHAEALRDECQSVGLRHKFFPFNGGHGAWGQTIDGRELVEVVFDFLVAHQGLTTL